MKLDTDLFTEASELRGYNMMEFDVECINSLLTQGFGSEGFVLQTLDTAKHVANESKVFVVRRKPEVCNGEIVAMATLTSKLTFKGRDGFVDQVVTHKYLTGMGLAREVMTKLLAHADRYTFRSVELECSHKRGPHARKLYESLGFVSVSEQLEDFPLKTHTMPPTTVLFRRMHPDYVSFTEVRQKIAEPAK